MTLQVGIDHAIEVEIDAAEFWATWYPKAKGMARKMRVTEPEDAAADAVLAFIQSNAIRRYDADKGKSVESFVWWFIHHRLTDSARKQARRTSRESLTEEVTADRAVRADYYPSEHPLLDVGVVAERLTHYKTGSKVTIDGLFLVLLDAAINDEPLIDAEVARRFGVTKTAVRLQRVNLQKALEAEGLVA